MHPGIGPDREPAPPEPAGVGGAPSWLEPYPDRLLEADQAADHAADQAAGRAPGPRARRGGAEAVSLGFVSALQSLPPRQRAALILCDVVGYDAEEVARMLDTTGEAVADALALARAAVDRHLTGSADEGGSRPARHPDAVAVEHRLVARFVDALEHADLDALIALLHPDVRLSMPPASLEYRGLASARRVFAAVAFRHGRGYRAVPTRANGQPAFGLYLADPTASVYRAYSLLVLTTSGDRITAVTAFNTTIMTRFGLPRTLQETD